MNVLAGSSGSGNQVASDDPVIANAPPLPSQIRLWEAWAKGYATVMQVTGAAHTITNVGPASIIIDEHIMLMSPSPSNPSEDIPGLDDEAQDGVLTPTYTVPSGGTLDFNYGDHVLWGYFPPPAWWCTEDTEYTNSPIPITMGGEILPYDLWDEVDNPDGTPVMYNMLYSTTATQADIWTYIRVNPTLLVGKLPLWTEIGNMGDEVDITLDVTNIGFQTAYGVVVTDTIPAGYSYDPSSFTHTPSAIINNPDGSITLRWIIQQFDAAVETSDIEPTDYTTIYIGYKLLTPVLDPDIRIFLPRAYVDRNGDGVNDVESEEPLLETYLVNRPPVAIVDDVMIDEGGMAVLDGSSSYDPDEAFGDSIVSYEWDLDDDGVFEATGPVANKEFGDNGNFNVTLRVTDSWGATSANTAVVTVVNLVPISFGILTAMPLDLGIRVAGSKWSNVMLELVDDEGNSVQLLEVERWPGSPDKNPSIGVSSVTLDMSKSYRAVVTYDPFPDDGDAIEGDQGNNGKDKKNNAGNPVWLTISFEDGTFIEIHHTFNTQQSKHKGSDHWNHVDPWVVELAPYLLGHEFEVSAEASDEGSDDITFEWSCGFLNTYYNDDVGPDPFPSPDGLYPFSAEDSVPHTYVGPETISLTVYDDDGGTVTETISIP
jgi:uncharacterized repeat protein (TIGR01451 family)